MTDATQPFARDQAKPFVTGPFLGGYVYVTLAGVAAGGALIFNHGLKVPPRHAEILAAPNAYPSRVYLSAKSAAAVTVQCESAVPIGSAIWLW